ncbi:hypothetical protein ACR3K2_07060 [Cryptosporidium serpentis]
MKSRRPLDIKPGNRNLLNASILDEIHSLYHGLKDEYTCQDDSTSDEDDTIGLYSISKVLHTPVSLNRRKATVMVVGNISAGKSTLLNWLLQEPAQKTGMAIETCGITCIVNGRQINEIGGETALMMFPELRGLVYSYPSLLYNLNVKMCPSFLNRLHSLNFIDTPGLTDGDMLYSFDVVQILKELAISICDLILVCIDPTGQALSKRLLDLVAHLVNNANNKTVFLLTKIDEIPTEADRIKLMCQITQNLSSKVAIKQGFDLIPIYIPGAKDGSYLSSLRLSDEENNIENIANNTKINKSTKFQFDKNTFIPPLNRIREVADAIDKIIDRKVQDNLVALFNDCQQLFNKSKSLIKKQSQIDRNKEYYIKQRRIYSSINYIVALIMIILAVYQGVMYGGIQFFFGEIYSIYWDQISNKTYQRMNFLSEGILNAWLVLIAILFIVFILNKSIQREEHLQFSKDSNLLRKYHDKIKLTLKRAQEIQRLYIDY